MDGEDYRGLFIAIEEQEEFWVVTILKSNHCSIIKELILEECDGWDEAMDCGKEWVDDYLGQRQLNEQLALEVMALL